VDHPLALAVVGRPLAFVALAALAFVPLEHVAAARPSRRRWFGADVAFATVGQIAVSAGLVLAVGVALAALDGLAVDRPLCARVADRRVRAVLEVAVGLVLFELGGYGYHRLAHRVPLLWRLHEVHHSSRQMDWLASFRQHPVETLLQTLAQNAPLVLLGVPLGAHAAVLAVLKLNTVFVHANVRVPAGPWELVFATPRFHHRHHQRAGAARNFSSLFPFVDRLFGTFSAETATAFGVPAATPETFAGLLARPFRFSDRAAGAVPCGARQRGRSPSPP
jgi:sterol desaturase/sphingolipid hydroxylase (fatty acid hydroxylase superfamily)